MGSPPTLLAKLTAAWQWICFLGIFNWFSLILFVIRHGAHAISAIDSKPLLLQGALTPRQGIIMFSWIAFSDTLSRYNWFPGTYNILLEGDYAKQTIGAHQNGRRLIWACMSNCCHFCGFRINLRILPPLQNMLMTTRIHPSKWTWIRIGAYQVIFLVHNWHNNLLIYCFGSCLSSAR